MAWKAGAAAGAAAARGGRPALTLLTVRNTRVSYADAKQNRDFAVQVEMDPARGLALSGSGHVRGAPVTIRGRGAPITADVAGRPWPFSVAIEGAAVGVQAVGKMDGPLDTGHASARVTAHGDDLALIDAIIEAGLPATQPVRVAADVRREGRDWRVSGLKGTIGRSDISGHATIRKIDDRTRIDGAIDSARFDFDDLASDHGRRLAAAKRARYGNRVVPDTAIDLATVDRTDGQLKVNARSLLWPGSEPFRSMRGTLTLDRSRIVIEPFELRLTRGRMHGRAVVDQRSGRPVMTLDFQLSDARLADLFPDAGFDARLRGRALLTGQGPTIRAAVGRSNGMIALVARDGAIPARTASLLGQDVGRGLTTDKDAFATLRCIVARFDVTQGMARAAPVVIDTSRASTRVSGTIDLSSERLAFALNGAPKKDSVLRLAGTIPVGGTISAPEISVPKQAQSVGGVLSMIGDAIAGKQAPTAADADCAALESRALS